MAEFVTRFAPSPTGLLHLGHAFSALTAYDAARAEGGRFLLRIEDIDLGRCKPEFEAAIYEDLAWLGLDWEKPPRRQSDHFDDYAAALEALRAKGLLYRCFKTRKEIAEKTAQAPHLSPDGPQGTPYVGAPLSPSQERARLAEGRAFAWRLSIQAARDTLGGRFQKLAFIERNAGPRGEAGVVEATPEIFGDAVLARKDFGASYHLSSTYDDALQGATQIIRGVDLFHATHLHVLIQALLDLPTPTYRHHRLITDENGKRFAKRDRSATLRALRESGATPEDVRNRIGFQPSGR